MAIPLLSTVDARVLGVLVEKQRTVPDTYPLSLNALTAGCNQKTSREPVMEIPEAEVQSSIDRLRHESLVVESSGGRVMRYSHNLERALNLAQPAVALLATLMLRGPQTAAELRGNSERLYRFADASAVEGYLDELAARPAGSLVVELPRAPGSRETRWMHLLPGGVPPAEPARPEAAHAGPAFSGAAPLAGDIAMLASRIEALEREIARLSEALQGLAAARDVEHDG